MSLARRTQRPTDARRVLRTISHVGWGAVLVLVFAGGCLLALVLYANLPAGRRVVAFGLQRVLSTTFEGGFSIDSVEKVSLKELRARGITVHDPDGHLVLSVSALSVQVDVPGVLRKLLLGKGEVTLRFDHARLERAEVYLLPSLQSNVPTIADAFTPTPSIPGTAAPSSATTYKVWFPEIEVGHIYGRMALDGVPTLEAELSSVRGAVVGSAPLTTVDVERFSAIVRGLGGADATGVGSVHVRAPGAVWTSFDGYFGEVQFGTVVRIDGPKLDVTLDVPRAEAKAVRPLWAGYPLQKDLGAHVEAVGTLAAMHTQAKLLIGQGWITSSGELRLSGHPGADLDLSARSMDLRALWPTAPSTELDADASLAVFQSGNDWVANVDGTTRATNIAGTPLPPIDIAGSYDAKGFAGHATVHEPGIPLKATFDVHPDGTIDGSAQAKGVDLSQAPRLQPYFAGRGRLDLQLKGRIDQGRLVAQMNGNLNAFRYGQVSVETNQFSGRVTGPLADPDKFSLNLAIASQQLRAGSLGFDELKTEVRGPVTRPVVSTTISNKRGPQITATATLSPRQATHIGDLSIDVRRDQAALTAKVTEVQLDGDQVRVNGLHLEGAGGKLDGSGRLGPNQLAVVARGSDLDLAAIAHALGLPRGLVGGKVSLDVDLESTSKTQRGKFDVQLTQGESQGVKADSLSLTGQLNGSQLALQSSAQLPDWGAFSGEAKVQLSGSLAEPGTYERATGVLTMKAEHVPFSLLSYLLPKSAGVSEVRGEGSATLVLDRSEPNAIPNLSLVANTSGLYVALAASDPQSKPAVFDGVDAHAGLNVNGRNGDTDLVVKLDDRHGPLASATARLALDLAAAREHPERLWSQLRSTPFVAKAVVDDRALEDLPAPIAPQGIAGRLRTELSLRGTIERPIFSDKTELYRLRLGDSERDRAIDVCAQLDYDKASGQYGARGEVFLPKAKDDARACQGSRVAQFSAGGRAEWDKLMNSTPSADPAWTGTAGLSLEGLPLDIVPTLAESGFSGRVLGVVMFDRREALPQVRSQLEIRDAMLARTRLGTALVQAHTDGRALSAALSLEQPDTGPASGSQVGGKLSAELLTAVNWDGVVPNIDDTRSASATLKASNVDAVVLTPFVRDVLSEIAGKLDANLKLTLTPNLEAKTEPHWTGNVTGTLGMRDGTLQLSQLGLRIRNVQINAQAEAQQGLTLLKVSSLRGAAEGNKTNVGASGNLWFSDLRVVKGNARVNVADVPFLVEGVPLATLDGNEIDIELQRRPSEMFVGLTIPRLEAKLPQEASRSLITLGKNQNVLIAQPISEPSLATDGASLPWRMRFDLGNDVKVTRAELSLPIGGSPEILLGEEMQIQGSIDLRSGGRLNLPGLPQPFIIENGTVYFDADGDPKNPRIKVRAVCRIAQLTVWATVNGTFQDAKIVFESDSPSLTNQAQIVAALLAPGSTSGNASLGAGAGYLGKQLLANTALSNLQLNAGSETTADQRSYATYSAAYPITDEIWFEGSYKTPQAQDLSGSSRTAVSGTFDWRFKRNWSLRIEAGNIGVGTDLLWQYRY